MFCDDVDVFVEEPFEVLEYAFDLLQCPYFEWFIV